MRLDETSQSSWWLMEQMKKNSCFLHGNFVGLREALTVLFILPA